MDTKFIETEKKLEKANRHWQSFLKEIRKVNREVRVTSLLTFLVMEFYINEILIINKKLKNHHQKMRFEYKLKRLKNLQIMPVAWIKDLARYEEIRNAYAHTIEVRDEFIDGRLKAFKTTDSITVPKTLDRKLLAIAQLFIVRLQRKYNETLISKL